MFLELTVWLATVLFTLSPEDCYPGETACARQDSVRCQQEPPLGQNELFFWCCQRKKSWVRDTPVWAVGWLSNSYMQRSWSERRDHQEEILCIHWPFPYVFSFLNNWMCPFAFVHVSFHLSAPLFVRQPSFPLLNSVTVSPVLSSFCLGSSCVISKASSKSVDDKAHFYFLCWFRLYTVSCCVALASSELTMKTRLELNLGASSCLCRI